MIWLTWRQFRAQAITAIAALAAFAILLVATESRITSLYAASGITGCHGGRCAGLASQFLVYLTSGRSFPLLPDGSNAYVILYFLSVLVILAAPAIIGIFWGAPLIARELETGTGRLVWNQSAGVPGQPGAWIISTGAVNAAGHPAGGIPAACGSVIPRDLGPGGSPALDHCLARHGIWVALSYQPLGRYWSLQFAETGLFLALALGLAGFCFWRLGRRPS